MVGLWARQRPPRSRRGGASGLIIAIHNAAMYLPAPLSGWIVDRYGSTPAAVLAGVVLLAAGLIAALAPGTSLVALAIALALLGVGWNIGLLSGTTALAGALDPATRARTQGRVGRGCPRRCGRRVRLGPHGRDQQLRRPCPHRWTARRRHPDRRRRR
jgi:MFS family permease